MLFINQASSLSIEVADTLKSGDLFVIDTDKNAEEAYVELLSQDNVVAFSQTIKINQTQQKIYIDIPPNLIGGVYQVKVKVIDNDNTLHETSKFIKIENEKKSGFWKWLKELFNYFLGITD